MPFLFRRFRLELGIFGKNESKILNVLRLDANASKLLLKNLNESINLKFISLCETILVNEINRSLFTGSSCFLPGSLSLSASFLL